MKRILLTLSLVLFIFTAYSQTTLEEYNFLTKDYAAQTAKGDVPELEGYYLEDLLELSDKTGVVKLLYKNDQESITPVATQFHIYDNDRTFYVCVPHEKSSKEVFKLYQGDIQNIFKSSTNAQSIFSVIMVQYPIELQKYFDEIKALEKAYATKNQLEDKKANVGEEDKGEVKADDKPKEEVVVDNGAKVVDEPKKANLVVKDYDKGDQDKNQANGKTTQFIIGGLKKRQLMERPALFNETTEAGTVKLYVCVDGQGKVAKVDINKGGTTTKNADLIASATKFAKKYKFSKSSLSRQCGYIVIEFK